MEPVAHVFKRGKERQDARPVSLTLDGLQSLGKLTLPQAAKTLGVSATALKGACRKLGITRWPYFAGRGIVPGAFDAARNRQRSARNGQCMPVGLWDTATHTQLARSGQCMPVGLWDTATHTQLAHNGQCMPVGLWDTATHTQLARNARCDAATQTDASDCLYAGDVPALVDADDAFGFDEPVRAFWS